MKNKSNIVIKVKYPVSGQETDQNVPQAKLITHWHVHRIVAALGLLTLVLASSLYFLLRESPDKPAVQLPAATTEANLPSINAGIPANTINPQNITPIVSPAKPSETKVTKPASKKKKPRANTKQKKKMLKKHNRH